MLLYFKYTWFPHYIIFKRKFIGLEFLNLLLFKNSTFTLDEDRFHIVQRE